MRKSQFRMLRCDMAGVEAVAAETCHSFPRHTHEQFGIGVIERGAQKSHSGRGPVEAGPGNTITVNPGEVHDGSPIGDDGRAWKMLYIEPDILAEVMLDMTDGGSQAFEFTSPVLTGTQIAGLFLEAFDALTGQSASPLGQEEVFLALLSTVRLESVRAGTRSAIDPAISRARELIDDRPAAPVTLAELARESGMSRFQLLRGFASATGMTPHAYQVQRRTQLARRLIAGGAPLAGAAMDSGFADQSHMTRSFSRRFGITPGAYAAAIN
jgi:AraC-like DNA-binding protein